MALSYRLPYLDLLPLLSLVCSFSAAPKFGNIGKVFQSYVHVEIFLVVFRLFTVAGNYDNNMLNKRIKFISNDKMGKILEI
jgi:hypothetical protein